LPINIHGNKTPKDIGQHGDNCLLARSNTNGCCSTFQNYDMDNTCHIWFNYFDTSSIIQSII